MNTGTIVALVIVAVSLLGLIIVGAMTYKKVKPTLKDINETNDVVTQKIEYFTREGNHITERVNRLNKRIENLQGEVEIKSAQFEELTNEQGRFQTSLRYLQSHAGEYASGISSNLKNELQEDGPKIWETFKRAFKKTAQKQKVRYKK
jgi:uncharacterized protein YoxC